MQPDPGQPTNVKDSVVGRDMHTGNVIHNHYHLPPTPQAPLIPQTIIIQQPPPLQHQMPFLGSQTVPLVPLKKIYSLDWVIFGVLSILFSFTPSLNFLCGIVSIIAILSMLPHVHLRQMQPDHPEAKKVAPAIALNSIALFLIFFWWLLKNS